MANMCNTLEKLPPPSFVTTVITKEDKRTLIQKWSSMMLKSKYKVQKELLIVEVNHLTGYVERKGTQLRLEKALMLTKQILKMAQRWKLNEFLSQLLQFQKSVGSFDEKTGYLRLARNNMKERLPSTQWVHWVIYLAMRDAALLAKICVECENTIKLWLGLIASGHHWSDSLVVCGILARVWLVSGNMMEDFINVIYPCLYDASLLVTPNKSASWPDESFKPPVDLLDWIQNCLKLPFRPIQAKEFIPPSRWKPKKNFNKLAFLADFFSSGQGDEENNVSLPLPVEVDEPELLPQETVSDMEDFGIVVERVLPVKKKKLKKKVLKSEGNVLSPVNGTPKGVKAHWRKFFTNVEGKLRSAEGRRMLVSRIKKYRKIEADVKLRAKLLRLKKLVLKSDDNDCSSEALSAFNNLQLFTTKYVKKLKKKTSGGIGE